MLDAAALVYRRPVVVIPWITEGGNNVAIRNYKPGEGEVNKPPITLGYCQLYNTRNPPVNTERNHYVSLYKKNQIPYHILCCMCFRGFNLCFICLFRPICV